jgi:hypothetical protein
VRKINHCHFSIGHHFRNESFELSYHKGSVISEVVDEIKS